MGTQVNRASIPWIVFVMELFALFVTVLIPHVLSAQDVEDLKRGVVKITAQNDSKSEGTGFIVSLTPQRAYIVTASHVIKEDPLPQVTFYSQPKLALTGKVLGKESYDEEKEGLAVLLVEGAIPSGTRPLDLNAHAKVTGGESITVIGFPRPLGIPWAVAKGTVTGRKGESLTIQLPVQEGNSGSPVLTNQTVVGVVVRDLSPFSLAVPTGTVQKFINSWVRKEQTIIGRDGAPMVLIPAGKFLMGNDNGLDNDERPARTVYLDAFYIDQYEVTASRYMKFVQDTGHGRPPYFEATYDRHFQFSIQQDGNRPVVQVSWQDAETYCRWSGKRLPTEAQWEKAARGPKGRKYPWGNEVLPAGKVNWGRPLSDNWLHEGIEPVGQFKADRSVYGVYDLGGNVSEWVADGYSPSPYRTQPDRNPIEPMPGSLGPMFRGSQWAQEEQYLYSAKRYYQIRFSSSSTTDQAFTFVGFRCARDAPE
jgi:formylglycine-generating enzyme required for sulfatase activity